MICKFQNRVILSRKKQRCHFFRRQKFPWQAFGQIKLLFASNPHERTFNGQVNYRKEDFGSKHTKLLLLSSRRFQLPTFWSLKITVFPKSSGVIP